MNDVTERLNLAVAGAELALEQAQSDWERSVKELKKHAEKANVNDISWTTFTATYAQNVEEAAKTLQDAHRNLQTLRHLRDGKGA